MTLDPTDPAAVLIAFGLWALGVFISLFLLYLVIRLAITHGMLSYSRQLDDERRLPVHRD